VDLQNADISQSRFYGGDLPRALTLDRARTIVMPSSTDLYFRRRTARSRSSTCRNVSCECSSPIGTHRRGRTATRAIRIVEQALVELLATAGPMA